jgi:hypothetical protein
VTTLAPAVAEPAALLETALTLAARGLHVFPLAPDSKVPALRRDWENRATTDPATLRRCWATGSYNIGIACGPSGLVVVDLDTPKPETPAPPAPFNVPGVNEGADVLALLAERYAAPFPWDTYCVTTGRGGMHLYFRQPEGDSLRNTAGRLGWLIDTRAAGGYVVGPGSIVDGRAYRVMVDAPPASLPAWLHRLLTAPKPTPARPGTSPPAGKARRGGSAYAQAVLRGELARILGAAPGTRNDTLNKAAFTLGTHVARGTVPEDLARQALDYAVDRLGGDTAKSAATAAKAFEDGKLKGDTP